MIEEAKAKAMALALDLVCIYGSTTTGAEGVNLPSRPNPRGILGNLLACIAVLRRDRAGRSGGE